MVDPHHFVPHAVQVIKAFFLLQASLQRAKPFDSGISIRIYAAKLISFGADSVNETGQQGKVCG